MPTHSVPTPGGRTATRIADHPVNRIEELPPWAINSTPADVST